DAAALDFAIPLPTPGCLVTHTHLFSISGKFHAFRLPQPDNSCRGLWKMIGISYERSQYQHTSMPTVRFERTVSTSFLAWDQDERRQAAANSKHGGHGQRQRD